MCDVEDTGRGDGENETEAEAEKNEAIKGGCRVVLSCLYRALRS